MLRTRKNALFPTSVCCWLIVLESCRITPPRMREKLIDALTIISRVRITPRMRGKHTGRKSADAALRITPAHAGKTGRAAPISAITADHPRTCGENWLCSVRRQSKIGSPPHMRGKLSQPQVVRSMRRITPAHAGKTKGRFHGENVMPDHPRTCGENFQIPNNIAEGIGSPPHMRGKLKFTPDGAEVVRITPAHAGKTCFRFRLIVL